MRQIWLKPPTAPSASKSSQVPESWDRAKKGISTPVAARDSRLNHRTVVWVPSVFPTCRIVIVTITIRQVGKTEGTQTTVLWFSLLSMAATGALMPFFGQAHDAGTWLLLAALGMVGGFSQICLTASLRFAPVPVVVPFDYSQLLWAVLLGWLVFADEPASTTWLGAAIIIASGLYTLYREHRLGREAAREPAAL